MPWLDCDGAALYLTDSGGDRLPLVLVHGWACDRRMMTGLGEHLAADYRVVTVDLRGHGHSDKPEQVYDIPGFAGDLARVCARLGLDRPVVIGHSMGGAVALELAAREPDLADAIVLLDSAVMPPAAAWSGVGRVLEGLRSPNYRRSLRRFLANSFFIPTDDPVRRESVIDRMLETPQRMLVSAFEGIIDWDSAAAAAGCRVPVLYIGSQRPSADLARFAAACPQLAVEQVSGSGHFVQLQAPDRVAAMVKRFLRERLPGRQA